MSYLEFDWRSVAGAWGDVDLSRHPELEKMIADQPPLWPSQRYREAFYAMRRRLLVPRKGESLTVALVEEITDAMIAELVQAMNQQDPDPATAERWRLADHALKEARRLARATRAPPPLLD